MRPVAEVIASEGLTQTEYDLMADTVQFKQYLTAYTHDLVDNGFSFAAKCKVLAEDLLPTLYHMARDTDAPAAVRAKIAENFVEWADLKPKKAAEVATGAGFSITINLPNTPSEKITFTQEAPVENVEDVEDVTPVVQRVLDHASEEDDEFYGDDCY